MAESAAINKSLTVLGQVVHALNTNAVRHLITYIFSTDGYISAPNTIPRFKAYPYSSGCAGGIFGWSTYMQPSPGHEVQTGHSEHAQVSFDSIDLLSNGSNVFSC